MALSLFCDCCLGQTLVLCAICVLMGSVIPGGAQGAQHSGGAAIVVLISMVLAGSMETLPVLHVGTCMVRVTQPCVRAASAPCMQICHSAECSQSRARDLPSIAPVLQCWWQDQGARLCWEDQEQRALVCEKPRPQDGNYSETPQNLTGKSHGSPSPGGRAPWYSSGRGKTTFHTLRIVSWLD